MKPKTLPKTSIATVILAAAFSSLAPQLDAATTVLISDVDLFLDPTSTISNDLGTQTTNYTTLIDGISTLITFTVSSGTGNLFLAPATGGILGVTGGAGSVAGIESRASEVLTITLTPTVATGITYTVNSGVIMGATANDNSPTFSFTNADASLTYASAAVGSAISSGTLAFASAPSGVDNVSFTLRQTAETVDTTEGGFLSAFTVTAIPEPSSALLGGLGLLFLLRRRRIG